MAAALKALGFTVILGADLDKRAMDRKILEFESALRGAEAGVFHYSGHGLQVAGVNYLVPVDAELSSAAALRIETVRLDFVQETMEREAKTNILFLDACRNNPLARNLARSLGTRSTDIGHGLAPAESGVGTLVSFSTQPGNVALDGSGRNSPYSGPLAKAIGTPGEDILSILTAVRNEVLAATGDKQVPWENHALTAKFYFNPAAFTPGIVKPQPQGQAPGSEAAQAWAEIKELRDIAVFEAFRKQYGRANRLYDTLASQRIGDLKRAQAKPACDGLPVAIAHSNTRPCIKPGSGEIFKDCPDCPEMAIVPSGSFNMGSPESEPERETVIRGAESPLHRVKIARPFAIGRFPVTVDEFEAFLEDGHNVDGGCYGLTGNTWKLDKARSFRSPGFVQTGTHPAVCVSWNDAKAYVAWLSNKTGKNYRLLSEAEREYAARAGTGTPFWWGSSITPEQANYDGNYAYAGGGQKGESRPQTLPVKSFQPNPWGLYQVHGNVWDWVEDCWSDNYIGAPSDGSARTSGGCSKRVVRGGAWDNFPWIVRAAFRESGEPDVRVYAYGFRVARTLNP